MTNKKKKIYVLDTNVLIQDPLSIYNFENNEVVIPLIVFEELDNKKNDKIKGDGEVGKNAREVIREFDKILSEGDIEKGIKTSKGGYIRIEKNFSDVSLPSDLIERKNDSRILKVVKGLSEASSRPVILVSRDIIIRMKAHILGLKAEDYTTEQAPKGLYSGRIEVFTDNSTFSQLTKKGVPASKVYVLDDRNNKKAPELYPNEFVVLVNDSTMKTQLGRVSGNNIVKLEYEKFSPYGIKPRNQGQYFFQEALMQSAEVAPAVIALGPAGTAKTFYSLAVGLEKAFNENEYRRILVCRPNSEFDDSIGFLPGEETDKVAPLMRPIIDNLEILIDSNEQERYKNEQDLKSKINFIFDKGIIQTEALAFIRGRSLVKTYLIIDEAQNLTVSQAKGILTRAGKGTKIILCGDPNQIDKAYIDERTNGLSYAMERMKKSTYAWQVTLDSKECERSPLAMDAADRM